MQKQLIQSNSFPIEIVPATIWIHPIPQNDWSDPPTILEDFLDHSMDARTNPLPTNSCQAPHFHSVSTRWTYEIYYSDWKPLPANRAAGTNRTVVLKHTIPPNVCYFGKCKRECLVSSWTLHRLWVFLWMMLSNPRGKIADKPLILCRYFFVLNRSKLLIDILVLGRLKQAQPIVNLIFSHPKKLVCHGENPALCYHFAFLPLHCFLKY